MDLHRTRKVFATWLALVTCVGVMAGCGGGDDESNNADRYEGDEKAVAEAVDELAEAGRDGDGQRVCNEIFMPALAENIQEEARQPCPDEVEENLQEGEYELEVTDIRIDNDAATAAVTDQDDRSSVLHFVESRGEWRVLRVAPAL